MSLRKRAVAAVVIPSAVLLGLAAAWFSSSAQQPAEPKNPTVAAEQPAKIEGKPLPREKYRFDGKTFAEWQTYAQTELKMQRRLEAVEAMRAFGIRGYGPEAAATIFQVLREHSREFAANDDVLAAAGDAFQKIGRPSVAVLILGLKEANPHFADLCLNTLGEFALEPGDVRVLVKMALADSAREMSVPGAVWALGGNFERHPPGADVRAALLEELKQEVTARRFIAELRRVMKEYRWSDDTAEVLGQLGDMARPAVPDLLEVLRENQQRIAVIKALGNIHCDADKVVPVLIGMLESLKNEEDLSRSNDNLPHVVQTLGKYGSEANVAVPALLKLYGRVAAENPLFGINARDSSNLLLQIEEETLAALPRVGAKPGQIVAMLAESLTQKDVLSPGGRVQGPPRDPASLKVCLEHLEKLGPEAKDAIPALGKLFAQQPAARPQVARVLRAIGPAGEAALLKLNEGVGKESQKNP